MWSCSGRSLQFSGPRGNISVVAERNDHSDGQSGRDNSSAREAPRPASVTIAPSVKTALRFIGLHRSAAQAPAETPKRRTTMRRTSGRSQNCAARSPISPLKVNRSFQKPTRRPTWLRTFQSASSSPCARPPSPIPKARAASAFFNRTGGSLRIGARIQTAVQYPFLTRNRCDATRLQKPHPAEIATLSNAWTGVSRRRAKRWLAFSFRPFSEERA